CSQRRAGARWVAAHQHQRRRTELHPPGTVRHVFAGRGHQTAPRRVWAPTGDRSRGRRRPWRRRFPFGDRNGGPGHGCGAVRGPAVSGEAIPVADDWQQFWEGTRHGRLLLPWCLRCDAPFWYPRGACPSCLAPTIAYREAEGEGVILAVAVSRGDAPSGRDASHRAEASPESQAVGFVELTEGTRMIAAVESKNPVV